ncbi:MAG: hypothetical protein ACO2PP_14310 [Thermocrinis sp.]|jgi:sulfide:quinone oxidoreductase|uniref:hypothetical protein n=1 Tax=Thermocrinis sp. TaxID=2024383 RepID=UPI003C041C82
MDKSLRITVVSGRPYFGFTPSYPHLALGWRKFEDISTPLGSLLLTFITSKPYVGHMGVGGVGPSRRVMEDLFAERSIKWIAKVKITKVEPDKVIYEDLNSNTYAVPCKRSMLMPRFMGPEVVASAGDKVANPANRMVIANRCFQNPTYKNIYGVGAVTAIPPVEQTPKG